MGPVHMASGKEALIGEWPWQVAIYDRADEEIICGGALIGEQWVLTAAHCVVDYEPVFNIRDERDFFVYLGKHYRNDYMDDEFVQTKEVKDSVAKIIPNERNWRLRFQSDLALLKLHEPAKLTNGVQLVCLPTQEYLSRSNALQGTKGWVAGWGLDASDSPSKFLREVRLTVYDILSCENQTAITIGKIPELTDAHLCAGHQPDPHTSTTYETLCAGDSGSPIVFQANSKQERSPWLIEGIFSHIYMNDSQECSKLLPGQFAIFTRVHK
ncbi:unnamed protein product [Darwinula stevensoni]|uniref:Peptidase S1 domain-containing protein n=1 Tax=Darwinula stevensoni TaxID=69355 RepID=A0A7R8XDK5_9CRUS|nr:unnamed protein product [Darwinula stevensoni]CAG0888722.1 unnamed protein product [Darwinula stevensoni]